MTATNMTASQLQDAFAQHRPAQMRSTVVPKKVRDNIYRYLFTEGVMVCEKNPLANWEGMLSGHKIRCSCLQVMYLMKSFKSRKLIDEKFAWRHFYWKLNTEGEDYLRKYLFLSADVVPNTQRGADLSEFEKRPARPEVRDHGRGGRGRGGFEGDRENYRADGRGRGRGRGGRGRGRGGAMEVHVDAEAVVPVENVEQPAEL